MTERRRGIVPLAASLLERLLNLPDGHRIVGMRAAPGSFEMIELLIEGPSLPVTQENQMTPRVNLLVRIECGQMVTSIE